MSIQLYNYREGLMGKVASDKCHKWVFKEPTECEPNISNYWQSSFDDLSAKWTDQFESSVGNGIINLCDLKKKWPGKSFIIFKFINTINNLK
ncbi:hypothetical protein UlMin_019210 [Ulmus minor]